MEINWDDYDYKAELEIDPDNLDIEFLRQPLLFAKYSEALAHAKKVMRRAEEKKKTIRSEIINEVLADPAGTVGTPKPTAAQTEAYYRTREEYKKAAEELVEAQFQVALLEAAVWAFQQRKTSLEGLASLMRMEYFSPSEDRVPEQPAKKKSALERQKELDAEIQAKIDRIKQEKEKARKRMRRTKQPAGKEE